MTDEARGFAMLSSKHDGTSLQAMPMLFTYKPVQKQSESSGTNGFQQAGGHQGVFKNSGPVLEKAVGDREKKFYEQAQAGQWPPGFLPKYYGDKGDGRIGIENLTHGMRCPCIIDLKMGTATVEATEGNMMKKVRMGTLDLVTGSYAHGVRLEGMSVYRALESGKIKTTKAQSHAISAAANVNLQDVLMFFLTDESGVRRDIASRFLGHLEHMLYHFEHNNNRYLFIGSSILLIYDNDNTAPHSRWARALERATRLHPDTYAALRRKTRVDVRMIDFAHTGPLPHGQKRDEGKSGVAPQRPIFSLATAAVDAQQDAASRKPQGGLAAGHESAPLMYPPQPEPPSAPHWNGTSYSFHHHHAPSSPLPHAPAHSHSYSQPHMPGQYSGPYAQYGAPLPVQQQSAPLGQGQYGAAPPQPHQGQQQSAPVPHYGAAASPGAPQYGAAAPSAPHGVPNYGVPNYGTATAPLGQYGAAPPLAYGAAVSHYSASGHPAPPAAPYGTPVAAPLGQSGAPQPAGGDYGAVPSGGLYGPPPVAPPGQYGAPSGFPPNGGLYGARPGGPPAIATPPPAAYAPYQPPGHAASQAQSSHIAPSAPVGPFGPTFMNLLGLGPPEQSPGPDGSRAGHSGPGRTSEEHSGPGSGAPLV